jgi:predicted MFS family arabinose efflux permease
MRLLTDRNLRLLWTAGSIASLGAWLLVVAVPLEVFRRTGSPVATGLALAAEVLPAVLIGPWAGVLVDRWHRKRVIVLAYLAGAAGLALMLADRLLLIYAGVLAEAFAVVFLAPALRAVGPGLTGSESDLASLNAWTSFSSSVLRMLGPPLGTLLAARGLFSVVVLLDVIGYLTAAVLISRISLPRVIPADGAPPRIREGVRHILRTPLLRGLLTTSWLFLAANAALTALLVPFVAERLGAPPSSVGVLISGLGVGYIAGSALSKPLLDRCPTRAVLVCAYAAVGLSFLVLFNAPTFAVALVAVSVSGVPGAVLLVVTGHRMQTATPDQALGRVAAAFSASDASATLAGAVTAPVAVAHVALGTALNAFSAAVLLAAVAASVLIPPR